MAFLKSSHILWCNHDRCCIKKILESDDSPTKSMVLVITEIYSHDNDDVTDGSCDQTDAKVLNYYYITFVLKCLHFIYVT